MQTLEIDASFDDGVIWNECSWSVMAVNGLPPYNILRTPHTSVYFENDRLGARLSYNYRSDAYGALTMDSQIVTGVYKQLDATANWNVTEGISMFLAPINITNEVIFQRADDGIPIDFL